MFLDMSGFNCLTKYSIVNISKNNQWLSDMLEASFRMGVGSEEISVQKKERLKGCWGSDFNLIPLRFCEFVSASLPRIPACELVLAEFQV